MPVLDKLLKAEHERQRNLRVIDKQPVNAGNDRAIPARAYQCHDTASCGFEVDLLEPCADIVVAKFVQPHIDHDDVERFRGDLEQRIGN